MRRTDKEITEIEAILDVIRQCRVCRIGMMSDRGVYIVPMNFGYTYEKGELSFYFHGAKEGLKYDILATNSEVGFELDCEYGLDEGNTACEYGYRFASVIGNGTAEIVSDPEEKKNGLTLLMEHQTGRAFTFNDKQAAGVTVLKMKATEFTCKKKA